MRMRDEVGWVALTLAIGTAATLAGCAKSPPATLSTAPSETPVASPPVPDPMKPPPSAADERKRMQKLLAGSGPIDEPWTKAVPEVFARWKAEARTAGVHTDFSEAKCFHDGCFVDAKYPDIGDYMTSSESLSGSATFQGWRGVKYRSPPEVANDGTVTATWALLRPEK